jgi:hypothetical protein
MSQWMSSLEKGLIAECSKGAWILYLGSAKLGFGLVGFRLPFGPRLTYGFGSWDHLLGKVFGDFGYFTDFY